MGPVVAVLADYWRPGWRAGGPIVSLGRLVDRSSADCRVVTRNHDFTDSTPYPGISANTWTPDEANDAIPVAYLAGLAGFRWARTELRRLNAHFLHINSVHSPAFGIAPLIAFRCGLLGSPRVLLSAHGELADSAQQHKHWKKRLAAPFLRRLIPGNTIWHGSSQREAADIRAWLGTNPTILIAPDPPPEPADQAGTGPDAPTVLFASRIHPIKGLDRAIDVVASLDMPVRFVVAGQIEDQSYWQRCEQMLRDLPANVEVQVYGAYTPADISSLVDDATVLVLPTKGENFGQVIAESLACGCPIAIPATTPWGEYVGESAGSIDDDDGRTLTFIREVLNESATKRETRRSAVLAAYRAWFDREGNVDLYREAWRMTEAQS